MDAQREAWLRRRDYGWGGSDIPVLLLALGMRQGCEAPAWMRARARHVVLRGDFAGIDTTPRIFAEKAGLVSPLGVGAAAGRGTEREAELIATWRSNLEHGWPEGHEATYNPATIVAAGPQRIMPLVDRVCPRLCVTPDAWLETHDGRFVVAQMKCSYGSAPDLRWYWRDQATAEIGATGADAGVLVCGEYWARPEGVAPGDGPVRSWAVERNDVAIDEIRAACREGWDRVRALRDYAAAA